MCLPSCPTYDATGLERHSPRGRIAWMRAIADGEIEMSPGFAREVYFCLGCLACQSACPAGVDYASMLETARIEVEQRGLTGRGSRVFWRWLTIHTLFMHPRLLRLCGRLLRLYQVSGLRRLARKVRFLGLLPRRLRELELQAPAICARFSDQLIRPLEQPPGPARYQVGLLTGCVQDLAFSDVNRATADVLLAAGCAVHTPRAQPCCGSLHAHNGELEQARTLARRLLDLFDVDRLDAIISNAGGCGSHLRHYGKLLAGDPAYAARAHRWDAICRDAHAWLDAIGFSIAPAAAGSAGPAAAAGGEAGVAAAPDVLAYHDSCHLCHGQRVRAQPRRLLAGLRGFRLVELPESDWCCGSAGIYSITEPELSGKLLQRKIDNLRRTGATTVATANPGCHLQLENGLRAQGLAVRVRHPMSLLAEQLRAPAADRNPGATEPNDGT
jgi:glycolate oxidase iron-sulfur subunit